MSDAIANFLSAHLPIAGLAAYCVHLPNRLLDAQCFSKSLYPTSTEEMLSQIVQGGRTLLPAKEQIIQYCWTFEGYRVYVAARPEGVCLALLVENNPSTQMVRIQETLQGFVDLTEL